MRRVARRHGERDHIGDRQLWVRLDEIHARVRIRTRKGDARRVAGPNVEPELSSERWARQGTCKRTKIRSDELDVLGADVDLSCVIHGILGDVLAVRLPDVQLERDPGVLWQILPASVHDVGAGTSFGIALHSFFDFLVATARSSADLVPLPGSSLIPNRSQGNGQNCTGRYR